MNKLFRIISFGLFLFMAAKVDAVNVTSLYQADIPVSSQSTAERAKAIKQGLVQVLIKVSGNSHIEQDPVIKSDLQKADYYIQEYSYLMPPLNDSSRYSLQIRYNANDINNLLKKAGIAYWGQNRPLILVWLAVTNGQQATTIIGDEAPNNTLGMVKQQSKKYGLPLIFPVMDVADISQVSVADVRSMALPILKEAARRYSPDGLLVGNINSQNEDHIESQWLLSLGENQWNFTISGKTIDIVIADLLNQVSQSLAKHYVVKAVNVQQIGMTLEVSNIVRRHDLSQLIQFLKQLPPVQQVQLLQVSGDVVQLSMLVRGTLTAFQQNADIGQHLLLKSQDEANNKLVYEWKP